MNQLEELQEELKEKRTGIRTFALGGFVECVIASGQGLLQPSAFLLETAIHSHSCAFRLRLCVIDVVEYLISIISPEAVNIQNDQGNTALHWAATNGHAKVVETLITKGKADYKVQSRLFSLN